MTAACRIPYNGKQVGFRTRIGGGGAVHSAAGAIPEKAISYQLKMTPVSIINFLEGTRFTPEKKVKKKSNYELLLTPKSGGLAIVLQEMHDYLQGVYDVTVYYPGEHTTIWDFFRGKLRKVQVN